MKKRVNVRLLHVLKEVLNLNGTTRENKIIAMEYASSTRKRDTQKL